MNFLTQIVSETMHYAALWAKPLKVHFHFGYRALPKFPNIFVLFNLYRWHIQCGTNLCSPRSRNFYRWPNYSHISARLVEMLFYWCQRSTLYIWRERWCSPSTLCPITLILNCLMLTPEGTIPCILTLWCYFNTRGHNTLCTNPLVLLLTQRAQYPVY